MPEALFLKSLEIHRFRAFDHLSIERLGRVNLIVGKNNVGKSSLLEALWLYAYQGHPSIVWKILEFRDEGRGPESQPQLRPPERDDVIEDYSESVERLFHHDMKERQMFRTQIGPVRPAEKILTISLTNEIDHKTGELRPLIRTQLNGRVEDYRLNIGTYRLRDGNGENCVMVTANGLDDRSVEKLWDSVALTPLEDDVVNALRLIAKNVERINLLARRRGRSGRTPVVKVSGVSDPVPLRSLGEGMNRIFGLALALVSAKDGVLLIDEIESGLHYSVQPDVWSLVFEVAHRLNIQVFATTHSWDCLTAFQEAAKKYEQDEGVLIRLTQKEGQIIVDMFDEEDLEVVAREGIEVR